MDAPIKQKVRFSLKYKFFLVIGLIIFFITGALVFFFLFKTKRDIEREIEKRGLSEIKSLAYDAKYGVLTGNEDIIDSLVIGRLGKPDIVYVKITDKDNIELSSMVKEEYFDVVFSKDDTPAVELEEGIYKSYFSVEDRSEKGYEFSAPILTEHIAVSSKEDEFINMFMTGVVEEKKEVMESSIGRVKIGLSLKNIKEQMMESLLSSVVIIFVVVGMSIAISNFFYKHNCSSDQEGHANSNRDCRRRSVKKGGRKIIR